MREKENIRKFMRKEQRIERGVERNEETAKHERVIK